MALTALLLVGFAYLHFGPEYATEQKLVQLREDALVKGGAEPNRYWLVPSFHNDACGRPMPGVELVAESDNRVGGEWSTAGIAYGEPVSPRQAQVRVPASHRRAVCASTSEDG